VIHVSTHGFAFPQVNSHSDQVTKVNSLQYIFRNHRNPLVRSGLVLSGGNWAWMGKDVLAESGEFENGILTALEVSQMKLRKTRLVVLSACQTGLGAVEGSEGTFGLKRAFKMSGVEQMLVTLWEVPDKETKELMGHFYTQLALSKNPVKAIEAAQKTMRNQYPTRPDLWGAFVLIY
jgi:CHAT domain-containing protein